MGSLLAFTLYSGVFLAILFLLYRLFMAREKQIALNRSVLLAIYALSFASWPLSRVVWRWSVSPRREIFPFVSGAYPFESAATITSHNSSSLLLHLLLWLYAAGVVVMLVGTLFSIIKLTLFIRRGTTIRKEGYSIVVMDDKVTPFSFGKSIVMSAADLEETGADTIIAHERAHIRSRHYLDIALAQSVCVIMWYNPFAWLMRGDLKLLHEYEADATVIDSGVDPEIYQKLLIRKSVGNRFRTMVNSLSYSKLKARIAMMQKEKSGIGRRWRALFLATAPILAFYLTDIPAVAAGLDNIKDLQLITPFSERGQRVQLQMQTVNGTVAVPDDETVWLIAGNAIDCQDSDGEARLAVKVDGKLITERTAINFNDIESFVQIAPSKEYPGGLWDIKLKK